MVAVEITPLPAEGQIQVLWQADDGSQNYEMFQSASSFLGAVPDGQVYADVMEW